MSIGLIFGGLGMLAGIIAPLMTVDGPMKYMGLAVGAFMILIWGTVFKKILKPLMQQEFQAHQQMMQLVTSGSFDQAKAAAIATQASQTRVQLEVEHAKIASQVYNLLSSDQKAKVADIMAKHQQRMQEHMQKNSQQAPATPSDQQ